MELIGTIQGRGELTGSFDFDQGNYELLDNKPSINGVELIGNKTSEDLHITTGGGGGGGTTNYNDLDNKPQINGTTLTGNKSTSDLGLQDKIQYPEDPNKYLNGQGDFTTPKINIAYSTEEQVIGTWIDGKPLYQRIFDLTDVTFRDNNWNNNILGTYNIIIRSYEGYFKLGTGNQLFPYNYYRSSSEYFTSVTSTDGNDLNIRPNMNAGVTIYAGIVTIKYTKITD